MQINSKSLGQIIPMVLFNLHCSQSVQRHLAYQSPLQGQHHLKTVGCRSVSAALIHPSESLLRTITQELVRDRVTIACQSEYRGLFFTDFFFFSTLQDISEM